MIKYLLEKFRDAPGPLKQARLITADLAEEVIDLAEHYLRRGGDDDFSSDFGTPVEDSAPVEAEVAPAPAPAPGPAEEPADEVDTDPRLATALEIPGNKRKQEFKVLAILWDALNKDMEPMSAKAISQHGVTLGLQIRHENVRKVIRLRLDKKVEVHTEQAGSGTIYRYRISPTGSEYFVATYLSE